MLEVKQGGAEPLSNLGQLLYRTVSYYVGDLVRTEPSTMDPHGPVLGPTLWNILFNDLLLLPRPGRVHLIAHADDVTVVI